MPVKMKPLTKKQLREVFESYSDVFTHWDKDVSAASFARTSGPVKQQVWFEGLRSGEYRPASGVRILAAPDVAMLHQFLDIRHRQILYSQHEAMRPSVIEAMTTQFMPHINRPLDAAEVLRLCEVEATDRIADICGVAALAAYLGKSDLALEWCKKAEASIARLERQPAVWELSHYDFVKQLDLALRSNGEAAFLKKKQKRCQEP